MDVWNTLGSRCTNVALSPETNQLNHGGPDSKLLHLISINVRNFTRVWFVLVCRGIFIVLSTSPEYHLDGECLFVYIQVCEKAREKV